MVMTHLSIRADSQSTWMHLSVATQTQIQFVKHQLSAGLYNIVLGKAYLIQPAAPCRKCHN